MSTVTDPDLSWVDIRPDARRAHAYRAAGLWRDGTPAADLRRWAAETPDAIAISAWRPDTGMRRLTYREYADQVERFALVLKGLGVGPGHVVAVQLPNWWQVNALVLACCRLGAVAAPILPSIRARELELVLRRLGAAVCVAPDRWGGYAYSAALASVVPRLPRLLHRVVLGDRVEQDEVDLTRAAREADPYGSRLSTSAEDPDRVSLVLSTSGTTGVPKLVLHTFNTYHGGYSVVAANNGLGSDEVFFNPSSLTGSVGMSMGNLLPLYLGAQTVVRETWDPDAALAAIDRYGVTYFAAGPYFFEEFADRAERAGRTLPSLRRVNSAGTVIPARLVEQVRRHFGLTLQTAWGMTEVTAGTRTSVTDDPPDWAARSVGRPVRGLETDLRADGEVSTHRPARLFVRGASVCLATMSRDGGAPDVLAGRDNGWYDTGDLAVPDGRGGIRLLGRAADRVGGRSMIPVGDVEDVLRTHPDVVDAAIVGYGPGNVSACAVVVSRRPLTLDEVRGYLDGLRMTEWYQPTRLELAEELPRNAMGKIDKARLRTWLGTKDQEATPLTPR
jgi:cyclohexanecarboxylate-CoA ligase